MRPANSVVTASEVVPHYSYELPIEEEERFEQLFRQLDVNGDGRIDILELSQSLHKHGVPDNLKESYATKFIQQSDLNQSGDVSLAEFIYYVREHEKKLQLLFTNLDTDKDGRIKVNELITAFRDLGVAISRQEAAQLLKRIDKDGSLDIGFSEWRDFLLFHPTADLSEIINYWRHSTYLDVGECVAVPDDFTIQEMLSGMWWRHLMAGGMAGAVSRTATAPLDRLKVFLQVHGLNKFGSLAACARHMLHEGGVRSLWRGNGINVMKIAPESAIKFMAYEKLKQYIKAGSPTRDLGMYERFVAGSIAGCISQTTIYPLEVLKTRLSLRTTGQYRGIVDAAKKIYSREGASVFFRGYIPNLLGIIPYAGIDLAVYETLKKRWLRNHTDTEKPSVLILLGCGTISSTCGQIASYPMALVRTRLQAAVALQTVGGGPTAQLTMSGVFRTILATEGPAGLYRGITPNFLKVAPAVSISYVVYEHCRQAMAEALQKKMQQEVEKFKAIQKEYQTVISSRQQLDSQLTENNGVKEELGLLESDANVFKLIGPVLVKQDLEEARQNVNKRIDYITAETKRLDKTIEELDKKQDTQRETLGKMQQQLQQANVKAAMKAT
ncbi:mitochondrial adenyl nucleotide antiporter SLC25A23-like [Daphnia carinata]|uniref:mitochondrial adenyl nucleotide antiporter SLC25A23-like n=1 Tax=Daphnia carinata TaxID=120202 RepID=UPI00257A34A1|nr:mitochondrial adenyl nucleotide antiporter SLC25A23-like [Daphnia carinata]